MTPAPILASRVLVVTAGRKVIPEPIPVWRVLVVMVGRRAIWDIRRVSDLAAVDLPVLAVVDRRPVRAALL